MNYINPFRPVIVTEPGQPDPTSQDAADLKRGKSFLDALMSGEIGGFQQLLNDTHAIALAEDTEREAAMAIIMVNPPTILDGREFQTYTRDYAGRKITVRATTDDINWAMEHLGTAVPGRRGDLLFSAYVYEVASIDGELFLTVMIDPL